MNQIRVTVQTIEVISWIWSGIR